MSASSAVQCTWNEGMGWVCLLCPRGLMGALLCCARDLKLDNTLLTDGTPPMIKLCDFGFAKRWENNEEANMHTHIG